MTASCEASGARYSGMIMKRIEKDELYEHLSQFLQKKGIDLKEGSYTNFIHNGCKVLAEAVNLSQYGLERARKGLSQRLDQVRQAIHERTAPKPPSRTPSQPTPANARDQGTKRPKDQKPKGPRDPKTKGPKKPGTKARA